LTEAIRKGLQRQFQRKPSKNKGKRHAGEKFEQFLYKSRGDGVYGGESVNKKSEHHWCEAVYDAKAAELILYGRALGLGHGEAEDVLQEIFLTLIQMPVAPSKPEHYCVRSFRNRAMNYRRSLWRRLTREWESARWFERSPEETPEEREAMRCLAELPVEQREVIVLKVWHGCTFEEIGGLLEVSPNTVAGRYRYGLQKMKLKLEGMCHERTERDSIAWLASAPSIKGA
jgi:RNA polymerase sigma-70 factor (ECF subfamily)